MRVGHLRTHLKTHRGEKSNKCNQCDNAASEASNFRRHLFKTQSGENSNKCKQCDFASSQAGDLKMHLKTHSREKSNECSQWEFTSSQAGTLRRHLIILSGKSQTNANNVTLHLLEQKNWSNIWKGTVEKSQTSATNVTMPLPMQVISENILKHTVEKIRTSTNNVTLHLLGMKIWGNIWKRTVEKVKQMQPMWLRVFSCKQFKEAFENAQWKKVKEITKLCLFSGGQFVDILQKTYWSRGKGEKTINDSFMYAYEAEKREMMFFFQIMCYYYILRSIKPVLLNTQQPSASMRHWQTRTHAHTYTEHTHNAYYTYAWCWSTHTNSIGQHTRIVLVHTRIVLVNTLVVLVHTRKVASVAVRPRKAWSDCCYRVALYSSSGWQGFPLSCSALDYTSAESNPVTTCQISRLWTPRARTTEPARDPNLRRGVQVAPLRAPQPRARGRPTGAGEKRANVLQKHFHT